LKTNEEGIFFLKMKNEKMKKRNTSKKETLEKNLKIKKIPWS
jgi:hypothetical protein